MKANLERYERMKQQALALEKDKDAAVKRKKQRKTETGKGFKQRVS